MTVSITVSDRNMINKAIKDLGDAEREMLRRRVDQAADALNSSVSSDFGKLVALALLEKHGLSKGAASDLIDSTPLPEKSSGKSSVFARRSDSFSKRSFE